MIDRETLGGVSLRYEGRIYELVELTEFSFSIADPFASDLNTVQSAELEIDNHDTLEIQFRVRQAGSPTRCTFWKLPIESRETIRKSLAKMQRVSSGNEQLEERTYDELAAGLTEEPAGGNPSAKKRGEKPSPGSETAQAGKFKSLAAILLLFGLVGIAFLAFMFLRTRNSLDVSNSALVGNFLPVNARIDGEITEVLITEGQIVNKGDVLVRLTNPTIEFEYQQYVAQRDAAVRKVTALEQELSSYRDKMKIAAKKLDLDLKVAQSKIAQQEKLRSTYVSALQRLSKGYRTGAITQSEYGEVEAQVAAADAAVDAAKLEMESIHLAKEAISSDVLILGDSMNDEVGRIRSNLEVARGDLEQFGKLVELAAGQKKQLEIRSPRYGQVLASYKQPGEFLKIADEVMAISYPGNVWASGQVASSQAGRVRPGQTVRVTVPAMHLDLEGRVMAVGHRSLYSKGNYSAEFRGTTATDVPIKVQLADLPDGVPSGLRLEMSITTGFGVPWIDELLGNSIDAGRTANGTDPVVSVPSNNKTARMGVRVVLHEEEGVRP